MKASGQEVVETHDADFFPTTPSADVIVGRKEKIGELFVEQGLLNEKQLAKVLERQKKSGASFGVTAQKLGYLTESEVNAALSAQFGFPCVPAGDKSYSPELVAANNPDDPFSEQLRSIRSELLAHRRQNAHAMIVAVVSPQRGDGRTHFAANLAVSITQLGKSVLIIDADLRSPRMHEVFKLPNNCGVSMLLSNRRCDGPIQDLSYFPDLKVLTSGPTPPNPQELVSSDSMRALLQSAQSRYDVIIIDTPPSTRYADAENIARFCETAVLVARRNKTGIHRLHDLGRRLRKKEVDVAGCVMVA